MHTHFGMLCFSGSWKNPLLWSHYANRHRGICLGFDVSGPVIEKIRYVEARTKLKLPLSEDAVKDLLFTKFIGWSYEDEWRTWARLEEADKKTGLYFREFDDNLQLREVIVGPLSDISKATIEKLVTGYGRKIYIVKGRLAYQSFSVVENKAGFRS